MNTSKPNQRGIFWWLFWGSWGLIVSTYIIFPLLTILRGRLFRRSYQSQNQDQAHPPHVSLVIPAYNEAKNIVQKLDNALALDYPRDQLEILVASDGSDDGTNELVEPYQEAGVRLLVLPRQGKAHAMNCAVEAAQGEVLAFSDADSMIDPDALRILVAPLSDPEIGGVAGDYCYPTSTEGEAGERAYWNFDRAMKAAQSEAGSTSSITGGIYVMRRSLYRSLPNGILDDFVNMTRVVSAHKRMLFAPDARATGPIAPNAQVEFRRKVRVTTQGFRSIWLNRHLLNPFEYGFFAFQILFHRLLRWFMVIPLLVLAAATPALWKRSWLYRLAAAGQAALHGAAVLALLLKDTRLAQSKLLRFPLYFDLVNAACLLAIINTLRGKRRDLWTRQ